MWDKILSTLRVRPSTPGKTSDATGPNNPNPATPARLPLKSKATSAVNCPQTGVWECAADTHGISEHRRFFSLGQPMPYGVVQRSTKGLGGFIGKTEDDTVEITWTLVNYDNDAT